MKNGQGDVEFEDALHRVFSRVDFYGCVSFLCPMVDTPMRACRAAVIARMVSVNESAAGRAAAYRIIVNGRIFFMEMLLPVKDGYSVITGLE